MRKHYADYYALGLNDAQDEMAHALRTQKALTKAGPVSVRLKPQNQATPSATFLIDWNNWKPGNEAAALLLRQPSGLKQLLGNIDIVSRGIADTSHDLIGGALANGIALGKTPVEIADDIRDTLSSPERALTIAITEGQRAKIEANVQSYAENGVEQVEWTVNDPDKCICVDLEGEVRNLGQEFQDGITQPPAHPNCQCDLLPLMPDLSAYPTVDLSGDGEGDVQEAVVADLAKYSPDQERDEHGRFGSGGGGSEQTGGKYPATGSGGTSLSRTETLRLNLRSDPLVDKVYAAENAIRQGEMVRGSLEKPTAPEYPKEAMAQARAEGNPGEAMRLSLEYGKQYDAYSRAFNKYMTDFRVVNLQSDLAKNTLDGTRAGTQAYINNVISQDWFKAAYGDGKVMGDLKIGTRTVKSYAGQYTSGLTKNEISINTAYTKNEPTILHEIAHYAQAISATSPFQGHGVGFAQTNLHITENVLGTEAADKLAASYREKGVQISG
jgi:putative metallohydrolase (TIGR04338 family)